MEGMGEPRPNIQLVINSSKYMLDFIKEHRRKEKLRPMLADEWADVLMSAGVLGIEPNPDACGGKLISWAKAIGIEVGDEGIKGTPGALGLIHEAREEHDG